MYLALVRHRNNTQLHEDRKAELLGIWGRYVLCTASMNWCVLNMFMPSRQVPQIVTARKAQICRPRHFLAFWAPRGRPCLPNPRVAVPLGYHTGMEKLLLLMLTLMPMPLWQYCCCCRCCYCLCVVTALGIQRRVPKSRPSEPPKGEKFLLRITPGPAHQDLVFSVQKPNL